MTKEELNKEIELAMENGMITKKDLEDHIPPCKTCIYKAIGMMITLPIIGIIIGALLF